MLDALLWLVGAPTWAVGGSFTAKRAIATAEAHYLRLAHEAWERDKRNRPQDKMDTDDWIGAGFFAALAFIAFPVVAMGWLATKIAKPFKRPVKAFFLPPVQKKFEEHVEALDNQKALVLSTAKLYSDVLRWEPEDHPDRIAMIKSLQETIQQQMSDLMKMTDPDCATGFDSEYLDSAKFAVKELTAGGR